MKVVHINNNDIRGGAAKASHAIHKSLLALGIESKMLVQRKFGNDKEVFSVSESFSKRQFTNFRLAADLLQMKIFTNVNKGRFSLGNIGIDISKFPIIEDADIIHLHWINEGFLSLKSIEYLKKINKPIVWTFHDMWGFTGGCHYSGDCTKYEYECANCPFLKYPSDYDLSKKFQVNKSIVYDNLNLSIVTCSKWLGECVKKSRLLQNFRVEVIPNTLDLLIYRPIDKIEARNKLHIQTDKTIITFGTMDTREERKGFVQLKSSLCELVNSHPELKEEIQLLIFGTSIPDAFKEIPIKSNFLGRLNNEAVSLCYNAADVFVAPSLEDNLPNTVMESLACGTPVVAFNIGGMPDMIDHLSNGYLAEAFSVSDLVNGIVWCINKRNDKELSKNSYHKVLENFSPKIIAAKYFELYKSIMHSC